MKFSVNKILTLAILILLISGCKKNYVISDRQAILFQYDYVNAAWGSQHDGFIIDNEGNVLTYNNPEKWNFPDKYLFLTESQANENIGRCVHSGKVIPKEELHKYIKYISNIASSKVSALKSTARDAGKTEFICYQFSESTGTYRGYLIKMEGDFSCENLNFYSKKVTTWMKDINESINRN